MEHFGWVIQAPLVYKQDKFFLTFLSSDCKPHQSKSLKLCILNVPIIPMLHIGIAVFIRKV